PAAPGSAPTDPGGASTPSTQANDPPTHADVARPAPSAESHRGGQCVVSSFEAIPHSGLMSAVEERIVDRRLLKLLRAMLRAGVMEAGAVRHREAGAPQGGVVSPVLCNVYLHRLDRQWQARGNGVLVRYADDLLALGK